MQQPSGKIRWCQVADTYLGSLQGPYHANRLAMVEALVAGVDFSGTRCLDFGCGDGVFMERLAKLGAQVAGVDINATMIAAARSRLSAVGKAVVALEEGGVTWMSALGAETYDLVFALNVLAYLEPHEEAAFYTEAQRILRPGGQLVVTHSNELFDMFTLNRYTVEFFARHFSFGERPTDVASLLLHPEKPSRAGFSVRENPLNYGVKLMQHGFKEAQQEFAILHELPPLLTPEIDFDAINTRRYPATAGWPESERWKLMFVCSIFGSRAIKQ